MDYNKLIDDIVIWLKEQVKKSGSKGLLVGVSGGIDSAVVACLIHKAAEDNSLGVIIPIKSSKNSLEDAKKLIEKEKIKSITLDLTDAHEIILDKTINALKEEKILKEEYKAITDANLRARMRMSALYAVANNLGYMVVGTDNVEETYTGYFTKYGDGGVDILPLKQIHKSEIYEMAKILNVPESIINKAPSADLWENQTDENEMGVSYPTIEKYLSGNDVDEKSKQIIERLHKNSEHKRNQIPFFERN